MHCHIPGLCFVGAFSTHEHSAVPSDALRAENGIKELLVDRRVLARHRLHFFVAQSEPPEEDGHDGLSVRCGEALCAQGRRGGKKVLCPAVGCGELCLDAIDDAMDV